MTTKRSPRREGKANAPFVFNMRDVDAIAGNLTPDAKAVIDYFVAEHEAKNAADEARYTQSKRLAAEVAEASQAVAIERRSQQNLEAKFRGAPEYEARLARLEDAEARAKERLAAFHAKNKPGRHATFQGSRVIAHAIKTANEGPMIEDPAPLAKAFQKHENDPAAGLAAAREAFEKNEVGIDAVFDAVAPAAEGVKRFMAMFDFESQKISYPWRSLLSVKESGGRIADDSAPLPPPGIAAAAVREFVALHVERQLEAVTRNARERGQVVMTRAQRTKKLATLREEQAEAERAEGYFLRKLIAAGEKPWIRAAMSPQALLGIVRDPSAEFDAPERESFKEFPSGTSARDAQRAM
jgi:hypothetical protein